MSNETFPENVRFCLPLLCPRESSDPSLGRNYEIRSAFVPEDPDVSYDPVKHYYYLPKSWPMGCFVEKGTSDNDVENWLLRRKFHVKHPAYKHPSPVLGSLANLNFIKPIALVSWAYFHLLSSVLNQQQGLRHPQFTVPDGITVRYYNSQIQAKRALSRSIRYCQSEDIITRYAHSPYQTLAVREGELANLQRFFSDNIELDALDDCIAVLDDVRSFLFESLSVETGVRLTAYYKFGTMFSKLIHTAYNAIFKKGRFADVWRTAFQLYCQGTPALLEYELLKSTNSGSEKIRLFAVKGVG